jgi:phosphatidylglycerophosphatase A
MPSPLSRVALLVSSFGYVGRFPVAPGTAGSAAALPVFVVVRLVGSPALEASVLVVLTVLGVWSATVTERQLGATDPSVVVIDEVVGMLATLAFMPLGWKGVLVGFLLFRLFDIIKPYPCGKAERLHGGWGIMADDVLAGVYANIVLRVACGLVPALR